MFDTNSLLRFSSLFVLICHYFLHFHHITLNPHFDIVILHPIHQWFLKFFRFKSEPTIKFILHFRLPDHHDHHLFHLISFVFFLHHKLHTLKWQFLINFKCFNCFLFSQLWLLGWLLDHLSLRCKHYDFCLGRILG